VDRGTRVRESHRLTGKLVHAAPHVIVIVGAGLSGALTAANILRGTLDRGVRVVLLDRRARFGRGLAYHNWDDNLLLNVPAGNMSALPEEPDDFVDYLRGIDPAFNAGSFVSRRIFGDYIEFTLSRAERGSASTLERMTAEVASVRPRGDGFVVSLDGGRSLAADQVVLALGHFPPKDPQTVTEGAAGGYIANPWDFDALDRTDPEKPIAILGAGHTALDSLFRLTSKGDSRKVFLISRRGLLPHGHRFAPKVPVNVATLPHYLRRVPNTIRATLHAVRGEATRQLRAGGDWRDVVNGLRAHTPGIWQRLPAADKRKFLSRVVPYWDIHRHRLAPVAFLRLEQMLKSGQVECLPGQVQSCAPSGADTRVVVRARGSGRLRTLVVGAIVNCTGPNYDIASLTLPLIVQLRDEGLITQDALQLGLEIDEHYQVAGRSGLPVPGLFYIGPMLKARYWEAIAAPELRGHAQNLARLLTARAQA
jgi:uncharacterized NAD(P)/FAD-binding protein YdhS